MTSKLARSFQRDAGAEQATRGFLGEPLKLPFARILQEVKQIRVSDAYRRLVTTGACALTNGQQEALYLDAIKGLSSHDLDVIVRSFQQLVVDMKDRPYMDLLGPVYMEISHKLDRDAGGEFFTPFALSRLLARLQVSPDASRIFMSGKVLACNEPTAGTGGMVLTFAEALVDQGINPLHTRWTVQDISDRSCYGAFINTTLWGIPATIICGNTLSMDVRWAWQNAFWHAARPWPTEAEVQAEREQDSRFKQVVLAMRGFLVGVAS